MGFQPSARMLARKHNVDIASLLDILSHCRPYPSQGEMDFIVKYLDDIEGMEKDECGNRFIRIPNLDGSKSNVMWSCHTDTVHAPKKDGRQNLKWDSTGNIVGLNQGKPGQCLGADDGAGMWLLLEMLKVGKPGLYIFHRGEEKGGIGSHWIEKNTPELVDGIDFAIAFDRRALDSVITHQGGTRCCSDIFGRALGAALSEIDGLNYTLDQGGSFTDTKVYTDLVPECTNVSVGYYKEHGPLETLDVRHVLRLREALIKLDTSKLPVVREPGDNESRWPRATYSGGYNYGAGFHSPSKSTTPAQRLTDQSNRAWNEPQDAMYQKWLEENADKRPLNGTDTPAMVRLIKQFPEVIAKILKHFEIDQFDIADVIMASAGIEGSADGLLEASAKAEDTGLFDDDADLAGGAVPDYVPKSKQDDRLKCQNCTAKVAVEDITTNCECPFCYGDMTEEFQAALEEEDERTLEAMEKSRA